MATKEHSLLNKQDTVKDQYSNLNLNHHNQSFNKKNAPLQNLDNADENSEIDSGDADPDGTLVADGAQNELSLEHPRMDSILDDWGFSRIEHSQSMNEFSSYFDQPIRSTPAAKRYVHGKRLLRPLLDTNISADDITPSEYSTGVTSAFNGYSVNLDENMFGNAISSSMASNSEDGPSENDVEGTSGENVDSILFSTALSNEEDVQPRHDAEEEDSNDEEILITAIMSSSDEEEHLQTALQVETFNDDISGDDFVGPGETSDNENEGAPKSESDVIAANDTAVEPTVTFPDDSDEDETAKVDGGGPDESTMTAFESSMIAERIKPAAHSNNWPLREASPLYPYDPYNQIPALQRYSDGLENYPELTQRMQNMTIPGVNYYQNNDDRALNAAANAQRSLKHIEDAQRWRKQQGQIEAEMAGVFHIPQYQMGQQPLPPNPLYRQPYYVNSQSIIPKIINYASQFWPQSYVLHGGNLPHPPQHQQQNLYQPAPQNQYDQCYYSGYPLYPSQPQQQQLRPTYQAYPAATQTPPQQQQQEMVSGDSQPQGGPINFFVFIVF